MMTAEHIEETIFSPAMVAKMTDGEVSVIRETFKWCTTHAEFFAEGAVQPKAIDVKDAFMKALPEVSGMFWDTIFQRSRKWQYLRWRQMVFAIWYSRTTDTQGILSGVSGYDHSTISNAIAQCYNHRDTDAVYNEDYNKLKKAVYAALNNQIINN